MEYETQRGIMPEKVRRELRTYVGGLERKDKLLLDFSYADGLSNAEIGAIMDMSERQVASRLGELQREANAITEKATESPLLSRQ